MAELLRLSSHDPAQKFGKFPLISIAYKISVCSRADSAQRARRTQRAHGDT
jgi:hypothetical protein